MKVVVRASLTALLTRHIYLCLSMIFGFLADSHRQNKQTAAVSSTLFITTPSQPCYCMEYKHKTIAFFPPSLLKSSRPHPQCSAVLLQSLELKDPSCCITRVMGWTPFEQAILLIERFVQELSQITELRVRLDDDMKALW